MKRPVLRYFGGKYRLAPWIVSHFPDHRVYTEPYGGAGSVLMRKERCQIEVWNDLDDEVYNLFLVLRDGRAFELENALRLTPYCRREFELAACQHPDPLESARRLIIRSFMGFGADSVNNRHSKTGFRSNSNTSNRAPAMDWINYPQAIQGFAERLYGVVIENKDAREIMLQHDSQDTLHYVDPPYHLSTRGRRTRYKHEMTDAEHNELLNFLLTLKGKFILSGYGGDAYDQWRAKNAGIRIETREALADGAKKRTEILWMNF